MKNLLLILALAGCSENLNDKLISGVESDYPNLRCKSSNAPGAVICTDPTEKYSRDRKSYLCYSLQEYPFLSTCFEGVTPGKPAASSLSVLNVGTLSVDSIYSKQITNTPTWHSDGGNSIYTITNLASP